MIYCSFFDSDTNLSKDMESATERQICGMREAERNSYDKNNHSSVTGYYVILVSRSTYYMIKLKTFFGCLIANGDCNKIFKQLKFLWTP